MSNCKQTSKESKAILSKIQKTEYAKGFLVENFETYKILYILQPYTDKKDTLRYILAKDKSQIPKDLQKIPFIKTPIQRIVTTSTTHLALLEALDGLNILVGANSLDYVFSSKIQQKIVENKVLKLADQTVEVEKILILKPDLVMVSGMESSRMPNYQKIIDAGIPVFINSEWLEQNPLGKAEWIKIMGLLLDKEEQADAFFKDVAGKYLLIKEKASKVQNKKSIAAGVPYKDTWYVPAGESFGAVFLRDAGAQYIFSDTKGTASLQMTKEAVFDKFADADIWLNAEPPMQIGNTFFCDYQKFKSVKIQQIYDRQNRLSTNGGNDYWESGVIHPEWVLSDLVKILYPEILPQEPFHYYRKIEINCK
ncbi:MAG: ABC transporter substrate-binding protein [Raineya sp.]|nr:ABC transporter substrate-binding protein [Raineya sp.]